MCEDREVHREWSDSKGGNPFMINGFLRSPGLYSLRSVIWKKQQFEINQLLQPIQLRHTPGRVRPLVCTPEYESRTACICFYTI